MQDRAETIRYIETEAVCALRGRLLKALDDLNSGRATVQQVQLTVAIAKRVTENVRVQVDAYKAGMTLHSAMKLDGV